MTIDLGIKEKCVEMSESGMSARDIFNTYFCGVHENMNFETFRHKLVIWKRRAKAPPDTMEHATYEGFVARDATVQVNASGEIVQAWVKQRRDDSSQLEELIEYIKENTPVEPVERCEDAEAQMLEIGLYDMHFPQSDHIETLNRLLPIIDKQAWDEINIIIGQDLFHNDDFRGRTSSGRPIEQVDMRKAWSMARTFWITVIREAFKKALRVKLIYSKGNHDESLSWAFVQLLKEAFPLMEVDDSLNQRKAIYWNGCFIGVTHGNYKMSTAQDLRSQFSIQFPTTFASAEIREIHAGHLHAERVSDIYGVMVRRLSRSGETDAWSDDEGFIGAHCRFMVFEYAPNWLKAIDYV